MTMAENEKRSRRCEGPVGWSPRQAAEMLDEQARREGRPTLAEELVLSAARKGRALRRRRLAEAGMDARTRRRAERALDKINDAATQVERGDFGAARLRLVEATEMVLALIDADARPAGESERP